MKAKEVPKHKGTRIQTEEERRVSARYVISAMADLLDRRSGTRMQARVADLSVEGCYVDSLNVFPVGAQVVASIRHGAAEFRSAATVAYALPSMGMGLRFLDMSKEMRIVLEGWIREAQGDYTIPWNGMPHSQGTTIPPTNHENVLCRLVDLLMQKNILNELEGAALLEELMRER